MAQQPSPLCTTYHFVQSAAAPVCVSAGGGGVPEVLAGGDEVVVDGGAVEGAVWLVYGLLRLAVGIPGYIGVFTYQS